MKLKFKYIPVNILDGWVQIFATVREWFIIMSSKDTDSLNNCFWSDLNDGHAYLYETWNTPWFDWLNSH